MKLAVGGFVPLLVVFGLLMAPVSCTCGAGVPHGHSLFQLPHHNHAAIAYDDQHQQSDVHAGHYAEQVPGKGFAHQPHPLASSSLDGECEGKQRHLVFSGNFALSNALEHHDGAVLKAPPSSSFGQPMVMAQPASTLSMISEQCEPVDLPATRILEGTATSPELPPPRV